MTFRRSTWVGLGVTGAWLLLSGPAAAQVSAQDAAAAEALYDDGTRLMEAGDYASACPKLAESFRLDPALGALLNLAVCRERARQTASAWVTYLDVVARAKAAGDKERETVAQQRADALAPRLPKARIELSPAVAALPGLTVTRDGKVVEPGVASTAVPVDPGEHVVVVRATGKAPFEKRFTAADGALEAVVVDTLADDAAGSGAVLPPTRPPEEEVGDGGLTGLQVTGLVTGGVGLVALGVGLAFGAVALGGGSDLDTLGYQSADGSCTSDPEGQCASVYDDASTAATLSTVLVIAGGALAATGLVMVIMGGDGATGTSQVALVPSVGGVLVRGAL